MRQRIFDLSVVLAGDDMLANTGRAIIDHQTLPHPVLQLIEDLYPREVARARFKALWAERDTPGPDPIAIGAQFKEALAAAFNEKGQLQAPYLIVIDAGTREPGQS